MGADITSILHLTEVDETELVKALLGHFGYAEQEGDRTLHYKRSETGPLAVTLCWNRGGRLYQGLAGEDLTSEDRESLRSVVEDGLLSRGSPVVGRNILMSTDRVDGSWRYRDRLQLLPAPSNAPKPPEDRLVSGCRHPCVLEFVYESSNLATVAIARRVAA